MCNRTRLIRNKWTGKTLRVSCGKCEACLQEKANARATRIRNHSFEDEIALFVTLTYAPDFIPYIKFEDIAPYTSVNIYRRKTCRYYSDVLKVNDMIDILGQVWIEDVVSYKGLSHAKGSPSNHLGVIFYKDLQDFMKRLRTNLSRKFNYEHKITSFGCAEYGATTKRPHFHLLIFCKRDSWQKVQSAIVKSWSYGDKARTKEYVEIAKDAASYVASYVNSHSVDGTLLSKGAFRQKHSYSKNFGVRQKPFTLASILEKIRKRDLRYSVSGVVEGVPCVSNVPIPEYVVHRFFPKFKGYSLLNDDEIRKLCLAPAKLAYEINNKCSPIKWTDDDVHEYVVRLHHLLDKFRSVGFSDDEFLAEYPNYLTDVWNLRFSNLMEDAFSSVYIQSPKDFYENVSEVRLGLVRSEFDVSGCEENPNARADLVQRTGNLVSLYHKKDKCRKVVNSCMSEIGHYV